MGWNGLERGVLLSLHSVSQSGLICTELSAMEPALSLSLSLSEFPASLSPARDLATPSESCWDSGWDKPGVAALIK